MQDVKREVHRRGKEMVLEKCAMADRSPAAVKIEERIGQGSLWENALVCDERCMRKIWWLVKALCHRCNGEDCKETMVIGPGQASSMPNIPLPLLHGWVSCLSLYWR